jgi:hypothetical protein
MECLIGKLETLSLLVRVLLICLKIDVLQQSLRPYPIRPTTIGLMKKRGRTLPGISRKNS